MIVTHPGSTALDHRLAKSCRWPGQRAERVADEIAGAVARPEITERVLSDPQGGTERLRPQSDRVTPRRTTSFAAIPRRIASVSVVSSVAAGNRFRQHWLRFAAPNRPRR